MCVFGQIYAMISIQENDKTKEMLCAKNKCCIHSISQLIFHLHEHEPVKLNNDKRYCLDFIHILYY